MTAFSIPHSHARLLIAHVYLKQTSFFLLRAGLTFSCGRCLVPEFGEFLLDSRGGGGTESKVILTFVSSSAIIILVDEGDNLGNYEKYNQRPDLVELTTQQERFVDQEKKVILIKGRVRKIKMEI